MSSYLHHLHFEDNHKPRFLRANVFYGNACKICFKDSEFHQRCRVCKTVPYCSKEHRIRDWPFHQKFCNVLKKFDRQHPYVNENSSLENFLEYIRTSKEFVGRKIGNKNLTPFERNVLDSPWVCSFCYSKHNLIFQCENCKAVVYCSADHKDKDSSHHLLNCGKLKMARIFDSLFHVEGFQAIKKTIHGKHLIEISKFPSDMKKLCCQLQSQEETDSMDENNIQMGFLSGSFSASASILYGLTFFPFCFKKGQMITRKYRGFCRPHYLESSREELIVHVVDADFYEITQFRPKSLLALLEWMPVIKSVELHLFGLTSVNICNRPNFNGVLRNLSNLQYSPLQSINIIDYKFPKFDKLCEITPIWHLSRYKNEIKSVKKPSVIVLFNYGCPDKIDEFKDVESQKALFKYSFVPVVITGVDEKKLKDFVESLRKIPKIELISEVHRNPYAESRPYRILRDGKMTTFCLNEFIAVLYRDIMRKIPIPKEKNTEFLIGKNTKASLRNGRKPSYPIMNKIRRSPLWRQKSSITL